MVKIVNKDQPSLTGEWDNIDDLGKAFLAVAALCRKTPMEYILEYYDVYIDGVEYTC